VKVAHLMLVPVVVAVLGWVALRCILGFTGRLLCAVCCVRCAAVCTSIPTVVVPL
jgi:hypothetical protein